ncbi:MAG: AmmeMemoRadiSam system protein B [Phycisphaerae bacterium]|nr:AmmeMemoRadiSam system protein B [Phycisphaerae bacterium]
MTAPATPDHLQRPHIRPFLPVAGNQQGQQVVALRNPVPLSDQMLVIPAQVFPLLGLFQGERTLEEISEQTKAPAEFLQQLVQRLDEAGLLWGPTSERYEHQVLERVAAAGCFPIGASAMVGKDAAEAKARVEQALSEAEDPELESPITGLVVPSMDYSRASGGYAMAWKSIASGPKPDRVVVLGSNLGGLGDGVVMSRHGFETPLGVVRPDSVAIDSLIARLGERLLKDELDFFTDATVQVQLPWIQAVLGDVPVVAALLPSPLNPLLSDDGARVSHADFCAALTDLVGEWSGRTLIVASGDLSHVGAQFGDPAPIDEQRQDAIESRDRELLALFTRGDRGGKELIEALRQDNSQRWMIVGALTAMRAACEGGLEMLDYRQVTDDKRQMLVSYAVLACCE